MATTCILTCQNYHSKIDSATVLKYVSFALVFYICYIALEGL